MEWKIFKREASKYFSLKATEYFGIPSSEESKLHQLHCVMGISIKVAEMMEAIIEKDDDKVQDCVGEMFWYTAILERYLGLRIDLPTDAKGIQVFPDEWLVGMMEVLKHYKVAIFDIKNVNKEYMEKHIVMIKHTLCGLVANGGMDVNKLLEQTINKKENA